MNGILPFGEIPTDLVEFFVAHFVEANLIKETQQPGLVKGFSLSVAIPHLQGATDKLIAAGAFHAVHAQVGAPIPTEFSAVQVRAGLYLVVTRR